MKNQNHPKQGSRITVEPIRNEKDIQRIKKSLQSNLRDLLLFTIGINNGLRIGDILKLKAGDVRDLKVGDCLTIREQKTGKETQQIGRRPSFRASNFGLSPLSTSFPNPS